MTIFQNSHFHVGKKKQQLEIPPQEGVLELSSEHDVTSTGLLIALNIPYTRVKIITLTMHFAVHAHHKL